MSKKILTLDNVPVINKKIGKVDTIEKLKASTIYSLGDVVEVLGFHAKGDGSHHKRVAKDKDDGSGEQGQGRIWWCLIPTTELNLRWIGWKSLENDLSSLFEKVQKITWLNNSIFTGYDVIIPAGVSYITKQIKITNTKRITIKGENNSTGSYIDASKFEDTNKHMFVFDRGTDVNWSFPAFNFENIVFWGQDAVCGIAKSGYSIFSTFKRCDVIRFKPTTISVFEFVDDSHYFRYEYCKFMIGTNFMKADICAGHTFLNCWFDSWDMLDFTGIRQLTIEACDFEQNNKKIKFNNAVVDARFERNGVSGNPSQIIVDIYDDCDIKMSYHSLGNQESYPFQLLGKRSKVNISGTHMGFSSSNSDTWDKSNEVTIGIYNTYDGRPRGTVFDSYKTYYKTKLFELNDSNISIGNDNLTVDVKSSVVDGIKTFQIANYGDTNQNFEIRMNFEKPVEETAVFMKLFSKNLASAGNAVEVVAWYENGVGRTFGWVTNDSDSVYITGNTVLDGKLIAISIRGNITARGRRSFNYPIITHNFEEAKTSYKLQIGVSDSVLKRLDTPYHANNMQKLGILDSYYNYLSELHEYEKSQNVPEGVMSLNIVQPPVIPKEVEEYAKECNLF